MIREFSKRISEKGLSKEDIMYDIEDYQDKLIDFFVKKSHRFNDPKIVAELDNLFDVMCGKKVVKAFKKKASEKKSKDEDFSNSDNVYLDKGWVIIFSYLITRKMRVEDQPDNVSDAVLVYSEITSKLLAKDVKKLVKKTELPEDLIIDLLCITPSIDYISDPQYIGVYSQKMLKRIYNWASDKTDKELLEKINISNITTIFERIFGEKFLDVISINILLEKKDIVKNFNKAQTAIWNTMTDLAFGVIEDQKKKHIKELLEYYCTRRADDKKRQRDSARRYDILSISSETYPKTLEVAMDMKNNKKYEEYI